MMKLLIGGSPCTHWSIAQSKNRETEPNGIGWELFKNFLIAKEKFKPDLFLYENNKSAAKPIKEQISHELSVPLQYINSALVSAQRRQRFYAHNFGDVPLPEDRGILLKDILETGVPVNITSDNKAQCLRATYYKDGIRNLVGNAVDRKTCVAEPIYVGDEPGHNGKYLNGKQVSQQYRVFSIEGKSVCCDTDSRKYIAQPVIFQFPHGFNKGGIKYEKTPTLTANGAWAYNNFVIEWWDGKTYPIYEVRANIILIKDMTYPINLPDGFYIIRKLTVTECCRLQTLPDDYCRAVSKTQAYKGLGNGWTAEVIIHLLSHALQGVPQNEEIFVLSMYDGIGTGRYCLDKMGYKNVKYHAYEIDKYAMQIAMSNYPDIIQHGDAFQVREER